MNIKEQAAALAAPYEQAILEYRHYLHAHPELSFEEFGQPHLSGNTSPSQVSRRNPENSGNAVVGVIDSGVPGPTIAFRADIDALPVDEDNDLPYRSTVRGLCTPAGTIATRRFCSVWQTLMNKNRDILKGKVKFIFQPAEEKFPGGAVTLCQEGVMKMLTIFSAVMCIRSSAGDSRLWLCRACFRRMQ